MQSKRVKELAPKLKWGDWSECSVRCLKTRHRRNCDDLVSSLNRTALFSGKTPKSDQNKQSSSELELREAKRVEDEESPTENEEGDEDLGPEEGDTMEENDEEEDDSCAQLVGTIKTYEEVACLGGQCKLSEQNINNLNQAYVTTATTTAASKHRSRQKGEFDVGKRKRTGLGFSNL